MTQNSMQALPTADDAQKEQESEATGTPDPVEQDTGGSLWDTVWRTALTAGAFLSLYVISQILVRTDLQKAQWQLFTKMLSNLETVKFI